jgi:N-acetylglucosamine kinase-like BadF-type ATPase
MEFSLDSKLTFGKHAGKTIPELLKEEDGLGYVTWLKTKTDNTFDKEVSKLVRAAKKEEKNKKIVLNLDSVINFGKNKGRTVESMIFNDDDVKYLKWLEENTRTAFDKEVHKRISDWKRVSAELEAELNGIDPADLC